MTQVRLEKYRTKPGRAITLLLLLLYVFFVPLTQKAQSEGISLHHSVQTALDYSPQAQSIKYQLQAAEYDLKQIKASNLPSVDLLLAYGQEQHSDSSTRRSGSTPSHNDWESRSDATFRLTQKIYDGGETSGQVSARKAILKAAGYQQLNILNDIVFRTISAHLNLFRQRELYSLAQQKYTAHQDIYHLLHEREQAGVGNISDVTQAQTRAAHAKSEEIISLAERQKAQASYRQLTGQSPDPARLTYASVPKPLPENLNTISLLAEQSNPELQEIKTRLDEAKARVNITQAAYKPKLDLQLNSSYNDQLEGSQSWENTNSAMVNVRWNIFNGGQDKAAVNAAKARTQQIRSDLEDKLFELREQTSMAWATYQSLIKQRQIFKQATEFSRQTLDAYFNQFTISQRSLLDVLSAENDYFQSARQLINITVEETLSAYHLLSLTGKFEVPHGAGLREYPEELKRLSLNTPTFNIFSDKESVTDTFAEEKTSPSDHSEVVGVKTERLPSDQKEKLLTLVIGPCIGKQELDRATEILTAYNIPYIQKKELGKIRITRLLEGTYPATKARQKLAAIKKDFPYAYILPEGAGQIGLYLGSFHQLERAQSYANQTLDMGVKTKQITVEIEATGQILKSQDISKKLSDKILKDISKTRIIAYASPKQ
jgi:outer membrane protein, adhesin transport system